MLKKLDKKSYLKIYKKMLEIRRFEERASQLYGMGHIGGFCHLYIGQEAVVVGVLMTIKKNDSVVTTYRDHGHMLARGLDSKKIIEVGAATPDKKVADFAMENSITGLEFLACIPGSIGGAIRMNTGCYGDNISKILYSIKVIQIQGHIKEILAKDIKFSYRSTNLEENLLITSVKLIGKESLKQKIKEKQKVMVDRKKISQPSQIKTCGSTFKNPKNQKAWELIKKSNCEDFVVGNAKISEKHCNFFVNNGNATSKELEELINKVKETVYQKTKTNLELEIKIIGYNN